MTTTSHCHLLNCGQPLPPQEPGQRPRLYCCDAHKLLAHRQRRAETQKQQLQHAWQVLPKESQHHLERIMECYGFDAARLALLALQASYRNNANVFQLLRHFSQVDEPY